jgi:hypothetical protein
MPSSLPSSQQLLRVSEEVAGILALLGLQPHPAQVDVLQALQLKTERHREVGIWFLLLGPNHASTLDLRS